MGKGQLDDHEQAGLIESTILLEQFGTSSMQYEVDIGGSRGVLRLNLELLSPQPLRKIG